VNAYVAGAGLLIAGALSKHWVVLKEKDFGFYVGLREADFCSDDKACETSSLEGKESSSRSDRDATMIWAGKFAFGIALATALASLICSGLLLSTRTKQGAFVVLGLSLAALVSAVTYLVAMPDLGSLGTSYGWSVLVYFGGVACTLVASIMVLGKLPQTQNALAPASPPAARGAVPACVRCAAPTEWVVDHGRFFCAKCRLYL